MIRFRPVGQGLRFIHEANGISSTLARTANRLSGVERAVRDTNGQRGEVLMRVRDP
jgi:hypothetical protein